MENNIQSWNITGIDINDLKSHIPNYINKKHILTIQPDSKYSLIEQFVYNIAGFNTDVIKYKEGINVEFYFSKNDITFEPNNPLISSLTYLDDSEFPTIFTNNDFEKYKYKDFTNKNCFLAFPTTLKHVCFNGSNLYGTLPENNCKSYILVINVYNGDNNIILKNELQFIKNKIKEIYTDNSVINNDFFEEMYYIKQDNMLLQKILNSNDLFLRPIIKHDNILIKVYEFPLNKITFNEIIKNITLI